jgi:hypothetical protein
VRRKGRREAVRKIECKTFNTKRMNYERFVSKDESGPEPVMNEAEASSGHRGRKKGGRNFAGLDLEAYYRKKRRDGKHHYVVAVACPTKLLRRFYYWYKDLLKETSK